MKDKLGWTVPGEAFEGRIETINPRVDPETRTGRVTVLLPNGDGRGWRGRCG